MGDSDDDLLDAVRDSALNPKYHEKRARVSELEAQLEDLIGVRAGLAIAIEQRDQARAALARAHEAMESAGHGQAGDLMCICEVDYGDNPDCICNAIDAVLADPTGKTALAERKALEAVATNAAILDGALRDVPIGYFPAVDARRDLRKARAALDQARRGGGE